jgi:hypothetical protein
LAQARDYNFSAYMNRAMIANDVSVAQQLALRSWVKAFHEAFTEGGLADKYSPEKTPVQGGPLYFLWSGPEGVARKAANAMEGALNTLTPGYVNGVQYFNQFLSLTQKVYHYSTSVTVAQTTGWIDGVGNKVGQLIGLNSLGDISSRFNNALNLGVDSNVILKNDPKAQLSELGLLAFVYDTKKWLDFTENRNPVGPWGIDYEYTSVNVKVSDEYWESIHNPGYQHWSCYDSWVGRPRWCRKVNAVYVDRPLNNQKDYTAAPLKDSTADNIFKEYDGPRKDRYANVVIDMLDEFTTDRNADWKFPVGIPYVGFIDVLAVVGGFGLPFPLPSYWTYKNVTHESEGLKLWNDEKHSTRTGANQGYKKDGSWNRRWKTSDTVDLEGLASVTTPPFMPPPIPPWQVRLPVPYPGLPGPDKKPGGYGDYKSASSKLSTGDARGSSKYTASDKAGLHMSDQNIFRKYRDVTNIAQGTDALNQNWTSPPLLIEVERSTRTIWTSDQSLKASAYSTTKGCTREASVTGKPVEAVFGEGNFRLGDGSSSNCMRAMAKAEAYFSRPADLFAREDNKTEYGSLYSPYWQARLVKTTPTDQALSMAFHYCDGKGNVLACVGAMMDSAKQETKSLWNTLTNLRSYLN